MKTIDKLGAQGDCLFQRVDAVPPAFTEVVKDQQLVVAYSETHHHHAIERIDGAALFKEPGNANIAYLQLEANLDHVDVIHHRDFHTHETMRLLGNPGSGAVYKIIRQRERTPEGWKRIED